MSESVVALYTALYMPTSTINLLSSFIFRPQMTEMGRLWSDHHHTALLRLTNRLLLAVAGITLLCVIGAALIGLPVLEVLFSVSLTGMQVPFLILIAGGGMNAAALLLYYVLTAMRCQREILLSYIVTALAVLLFAHPIVKALGIVGASLTYAGFLTMQTMLLYAIIRLRLKTGE